jgi:hypothetical protein
VRTASASALTSTRELSEGSFALTVASLTANVLNAEKSMSSSMSMQ